MLKRAARAWHWNCLCKPRTGSSPAKGGHIPMFRSQARRQRFVAGAPALVTLFLAAAATSVSANPPDIPAGSKLAYNFNVIGHPADQTYNGDCGAGHRIFVNRDAKGAQVRVTNSDTGWRILDCNATSDHTAVLATSDVDVYDIYVRILGKPGGTIHICGNTLLDALSGEELCLLGTIDLTRGSGQSKFTLAPSALFNASVEDLLWTVDTNSDFRIAQFRVYSRP